MSSSNNNLPTSNNEPTQKKTKHWVCCLSKDMKKQAEFWIDNRKISFLENYEILKFSKNCFRKVENKDILHIYCHGSSEGITLFHNDAALNPQEFLEFLKDNGLSSKHSFIELDACYSDKFAEELARVARSDYPKLCISGFPNQYVVCQGDNYENLANLVEPLVKETTNGLWAINKPAFENEDINKYIADKHEKKFYTNPPELKQEPRRSARRVSIAEALAALKIEDETNKTEKKEAQSRTTNDKPATTASSPYGRGFIIRKPEEQPKQRGDLPGRKSWAEILREAENNPENQLNQVSAPISNPTDNQANSGIVQESKSNDNIAENEENHIFKSPKF